MTALGARGGPSRATSADGAEPEAARAQRLAAQLAAQAPRYFPEIARGQSDVQLLRVYRGALASVYAFELRSGSHVRGVMLKLPRPPGAAPDPAGACQPDRPRVAPVLAARERIESEHAALAAIEAKLCAQADPRFGWIRVLDLLRGEPALVTQRAEDPPLKQRLARAHRLAPAARGAELRVPFRNAGAWLRNYHELPALAHTRERGALAAEFGESLRRLADFLVERGAPPSLGELARGCAREAQRLLPAQLPLGTSHGDLAPRNVLVGPAGRVTLLDTRAAWRAPIYEDLAYFGVSLRSARAQLYSGGLFFRESLLQELETSFLAGYFGAEPVPAASLRLFRVQCLLDRWASLVHAERETGIAGRARIAAAHHTLWRALRASCAAALRASCAAA